MKAIDTELDRLAGELVPERLVAREVPGVVRVLRRIEQKASGARVVLSDAAAATGAWRAEGFASPEAWAASRDGTSMGQARSELKASKQLGDLPATRDALGKGEISTETAKGVAEGATADRGVEGDLLGMARKGDLAGVRDGARSARRRADEKSGKAVLRQYRRRSLRTWQDLDGEGHGAWNVPPSFQAVVEAAMKPYRDQAFAGARAAGVRTPEEALMADALYAMCRDTLADRQPPTPTPPPGPTPPTGPTPPPPPGPTPPPPPTPTGPTPPTPPSGPARPGSTTRPGSTPSAGTTRRTPDVEPDREPTLFGPPPGAPASGGDTAETGTDDPQRHDPTATSGHDTDAEDAPGPVPPRPHPGGRRRAPAQITVHVDHTALLRGYATDGETCEIPGLGTVPVAYVRDLANDAICHVVLTGTDVTVISTHRRYIPIAVARALDQRDPTCVTPGCRRRHHLETHHWRTDYAKDGPTELDNLCRLCRYHHHLVTWCGYTLTGGPDHWQLLPPGTDPTHDPP